MLWPPRGRDEVVNTASAVPYQAGDSVAVPSTVPPSSIVTVPVGVPDELLLT